MFKIYGGDTKFTQWTKNQKLIMSRLPIGAEVLFYNDPKEDEPLVTEVYEYTDENGISFHVCDVPNIFLTDTKRIKVRIPSKVVGLYGIVHSYVGQLERYFEVEPAEKPADYVYEETPTEGCEGQIQADLSQTDSAQVDYVKGVLRTEHLPEGYPYNEIGIILDGTFEFVDRDGVHLHQIADENFSIADGKSYTVIWDGITYQCVATAADNGLLALGNLAIYGAEYDTGEPFLFMDQNNGRKVIGTNDTAATHAITVRGEVAYPIASEFLPKGYPYKSRGVVLSKTTVQIGTADRPVDLPFTINFIERSLYEVVWDGITYEVVAYNIQDATAIGNAALLDMGNDTGEPFVIASLYGRTRLFAETDGSHTIVIRGEIIHPMATEFLPDEYVTETELASKGYLTSYTETDPTVPAWAKAKTKPSYDFSELTVTDPEAAKAALAIENGMILKNLRAAMPSSIKWQSVAYGNGKFVAVASYSTKAAYSEDGITWTATTIPISVNWYSVTYGNGKFVAVAPNSSKAAYSEDGITWTSATLPSSIKWQSVTYGNGKFVAVANTSDKAAYSEDGITWTSATLPSSADWYSVTYGNGKFVAVASSSTDTACSYDGINWQTELKIISQNNSDITESVRSVINNETIVGVPVCTAADNGKVLKVVNGVPTWVEA